MDVGTALVDRVDQDLLDVLDDRGVLDFRVFLVGQRGDAAVLEIELQLAHVGEIIQRRAFASSQPGDRLRELVVLDHDGLDDEVRLEPHLLERLEVGGIGGRDVDPVAALLQRQNPPRLRHLGVDQIRLIWSRSNADRSMSGTPKAREPKVATCNDDIFLPCKSCSTNVMLAC